jgi:type VI protein secretion system component Hcp
MSDETKQQPEKIEQPAEPTSTELSEAALKQVAGGATTQAEAPTESVSFAYSKIKVSYEEQR